MWSINKKHKCQGDKEIIIFTGYILSLTINNLIGNIHGSVSFSGLSLLHEFMCIFTLIYFQQRFKHI